MPQQRGKPANYIFASINEVQGHFTINSYLPAASSTTRTFSALSGKVSVAVLLAGTNAHISLSIPSEKQFHRKATDDELQTVSIPL